MLTGYGAGCTVILHDGSMDDEPGMGTVSLAPGTTRLVLGTVNGEPGTGCSDAGTGDNEPPWHHVLGTVSLLEPWTGGIGNSEPSRPA